jgi:hypothetical protein
MFELLTLIKLFILIFCIKKCNEDKQLLKIISYYKNQNIMVF